MKRRHGLVALVGALGMRLSIPAHAQRASTALPTVHVLQPPLALPALQRTRTVRICLPEGHASGTRRYPVIYMPDGQNLFDEATAYAGEWGVDETMRELSQRHGFEAIVVGIDHGGEQRNSELCPWPHPQIPQALGAAFTQDVVHTIRPFVNARYRTLTAASDTAVIGSSLGGLWAHHAAHHHPEVFGRVGIFSPSYWVSDQAEGLAKTRPLPSTARLYMYAGGSEGPGVESDARRMHATLAKASAAPPALALNIVRSGQHNEAAWRAEFATAVRWLFELG